MLDCLNEMDGNGLAAIQLGEPIRLIAIACRENDRKLDCPALLVNPEISNTEGEMSDIEGCFSLPGVWLEIRRPNIVHVNALSIDGSPLSMQFNGYLARGVMHEIDHLEGRLIWDHLPEPEREKAIKQYLLTL